SGAAPGVLAGYDQAVHAQRLDQRRTSGKLYEMPKPTLAALPGPAAGAGLALALACDLRMAASTAFLTTAFANVGFSGDYGGTWFMSRLVGEAKTKELYFLSERVGAEEAARLGLVNWVVAPDELETRSRELARRLAAGPTVAYRYMKENINRASLAELGDSMDLEVTHHIRCSYTEDHREASRAFVEKRPPVFHGR
ncbi:MAG: enoyl-CoA hydratase-related protein, partial [Acidimicrobiales bacterium]